MDSEPDTDTTEPVEFVDEPELSAGDQNDADAGVSYRATETQDEDSGTNAGEEANHSLTNEQKELNRLSKRPTLRGLKPAIVQDTNGDRYPLFEVGQSIIVERCTELLEGCPWLDTRLYEVASIDDDTGAVRCLDPEFKHQAVVSYRSPFHRIVFPSKRGNPFTGGRGNSGTVTPKPPQEKGSNVEVGDTNATKKKGRGRPKGAKNRPKEVVAAEKAARAEEKLAKHSSLKPSKQRTRGGKK